LLEIRFLWLGAQWARADDGAFDGAQQAVRKRGQRGRGRRVGLHFSAPCAEEQPQRGQRQPDHALAA
jgi:hypothetical protein